MPRSKKSTKDMPLSSRYARYLESKGYKEVQSGSGKFRVFYKQYDIQSIHVYYHLGKAGAVYVSRDGKITHAISITGRMRSALEKWEKENGYN